MKRSPPAQVKQGDVLRTVAKMITEKFGCKVYSDEALEGFEKPCFFVKFTATAEPQTINVTKKSLSIYVTYFADDDKCNEIHYLDIFDSLQEMFQIGITVGDRYLHIDDLSERRIGDQEDILQAVIRIEYLDYLTKPKKETSIMEEIGIIIKTNENRKDEETWQN